MSDVGLSPEARERSKLYDASAKVYAAYFPLVWRFLFPKLHGWLAKQFADRGHILDAGTGPGYWVDYLARTEPRERVVGLDFSEESIKIARRRVNAPATAFQLGDLTATPFEDASFDGVLCTGVLDTFADPARALREFQRILRPKGVVVLVLRGPGERTSRALERFFRFTYALPAALRNRSISALRMPDHLWNRNPLWQRLPDLARQEQLEVRVIEPAGLITKVVLVKTPDQHGKNGVASKES